MLCSLYFPGVSAIAIAAWPLFARKSLQEQNMKSQVLIVGAGPVGLPMAAELARYGVSVRIVDKAAQRTDKSKAVVLWSRTLELLDRAGCTDAFVAAGNKVDAANIIAGKTVMAHIDISDVASPYPYALMLPQSDTERLLEEHLGRLGVHTERQTEMTSFTQNESGVRTVLRNADGREEVVETDWLIGCDGAHSTVRHGLGLSFLGDTLQSDWILADLHLSGYPLPTTEMATYWHEDGVLLVIPMSATRFRVIADIGLSNGVAPVNPTLDQVQKIIDHRGPGGMVTSDPIWLSAFRINERKVRDYRASRVFVAGDAAHVHSPAGGQGMNTGMQDAFNLAWKLALVCRGSGTEMLLDSFSVERSAVGAEVLKAAGRLTMVATMRNHTAQAVRNLFGRLLLGLAPVRRAMVDTMSEVSIGYDHSPLNGPGAHGVDVPAPGKRVAPISGQTPVGSGDAPRFALFAASTSNASSLVNKFPDLIYPAIRAPLDAAAIVLVRPDGYVACTAKIDDVGIVADYLDRIGVAAPDCVGFAIPPN
jgi:2-polyprenyl-6-methoxyphenol hydroxylase-like FAD-dependent oxidoreductase